MMMTSLLWCHLYLERSQSVQYFAQQFSFATQSVEQYCEFNEKSEQVQQANMFKCQILMFHFSTCHSNSCKHLYHHVLFWPHDGIDRCDHCIGRRNNTATRSTTLSWPWANFCTKRVLLVLWNTCHHILDASQTAFALSPFAHSKWITEGCSLWDDFNGNVAISNIYGWCHSDIIVIKLRARTQN